MWSDGSDDGAAAWDQAPAGGASAWDHDADPGAAWDAPASAVSSSAGWGEGAAPAAVPRSVWDDDAPAPASTWGDATTGGAAAAEPADAAPAPARRRRAPRAGAARPEPPAGDAAPSPDDAAALRDEAAPPSDEVAAVAARLAEIVGRSGARARPDAGATPAPAPWDADDDADPDAGQRRGTASGGGYGSARACGSSRSSARPGGRRGGGRRGAPASEPPEDGPAAQDAEPDHESVARSVALRLLTAAPKSRYQLAEAMAKRDVPEEVAGRVLDRFTEVGLVDDAAYAEILVRSRHTERGLSRRALAQELRRRGVDDETAQEALEQVDDADEEQAARALARKKLRATRGLDRETRLRRAYGALGRRGYGGSLVSRVVREELDAEGVDEPDAEHWSGGLGGG